MLSGLLMMGAAYLVRIILLRQAGLEAVGLFQAAWTLGGVYVNLVLQAMGADFYPRLVASAKDPASCNRLVNEQTQISLLLASAGVVATLVLAPFVLTLFYSSGFTAATDTLRWVCLGMALRVVTWPMGYIIVARGEQRLFILAELAWTVVNVGLTYAAVRLFGLPGAGIAYFLSYAFHAVLIYAIVRRLSGYRMATLSLRMIVSYSLLIGSCFVAFAMLPAAWAWTLGVAALLLACAGSLHHLRQLVPPHALPHAMRWLLPFWGSAKPADKPGAP
jgi:PST family polysaccharide transporter